MTQKIQRSVFIGLGGTGQSALLHLKKKLIDVYGEVPAACSFVSFDTDAPGELVDRHNRPVTLSAGEFKKLELKAPRPILQNPEVTPWWSTATPARALGKGAGGLRQLGRLALFANGADVYQKIQAAIQRVSAWPVGNISDRFQVIDDSVRVNVIGSIAGGTGAGMFLDVGMIVRSLTTEMDIRVAHLLMPDVFVGLPGVYNAERNAYAAAQEIDMLRGMGTGASDDYSYTLGGRTITVQAPPFDIVFLVNNRNGSGKTYPDVAELTEFIGLGSFLAIGATGTGTASIWDNIASQEKDPWDGRELNYASYGLAELFFDRERYADFYAKRISKEIVDSLFFTGEKRDIASEVRNFLVAESLVEDDSDQVIDAILRPGDYTKFMPPQDLSPDILKGLIGRRDSYLAQVDRELEGKAAAAALALRQDKASRLHEYINARLAEPGGFTYARSFLESLAGTLKVFGSMMGSERDAFVERLRLAPAQYTTLGKEAEDAIKAIFGGADKKRRAAGNIAKALMGEASCKLEIRRREEAMGFFASLSEHTNGLIASLTDVAGVAHVANTELSSDIEKMRTAKTRHRPFELLLEPRGLYDVDVQVSSADFLRWLGESVHMTLADLGSLRGDAFVDIIHSYAESQPLVKDMMSTTIDRAVSMLSPKEQERYLKELFDMSAPLWSYNTGYVVGDRDTEMLRLIGFPNQAEPTFSLPVRQAAGASDTDAVISTGDDQRVFVFTAEALLPAFVVDSFPVYREKYLAIEPKAREKYHINRTWIKNLVDLSPNIRSGQSHLWALANAMADIKKSDSIPFGAVVRNGNVYYFVSKSHGDSLKRYEVKLGPGRVSAFEKFMESPEYHAEVEDQLQDELRRRGNPAVADALKRYATDFQGQSGTIQKEDVRGLVRQELKDLEGLIEDITTLG